MHLTTQHLHDRSGERRIPDWALEAAIQRLKLYLLHPGVLPSSFIICITDRSSLIPKKMGKSYRRRSDHWVYCFLVKEGTLITTYPKLFSCIWKRIQAKSKKALFIF